MCIYILYTLLYRNRKKRRELHGSNNRYLCMKLDHLEGEGGMCFVI